MIVSMLALDVRPTREAAAPARAVPLRCLCTVSHGDDVCIVLAPSRAAVDDVARERRLRLGLMGVARIEAVAMVPVADGAQP